MKEPKSYSIEKLNESNYHSWSQVIEPHLNDHDLWDVVNGTTKEPISPAVPAGTQTAEQAPAHSTVLAEYEMKMEEWKKKTKKGRKLIISMISPSIMVYVEGRQDPAEM